jgi:hypothetical protein
VAGADAGGAVRLALHTQSRRWRQQAQAGSGPPVISESAQRLFPKSRAMLFQTYDSAKVKSLQG